MFVSFAHRYCFGSDEYTVNNEVTLINDDNGLDDVSSQDTLQRRSLPPIRYSVIENLKYTLRHEDILTDMRDIVRNR